MNINPKLLEAAAAIARPEIEWKFCTKNGRVRGHGSSSYEYCFEYHCDSDAMKLERALKKSGFTFEYYERESVFCATYKNRWLKGPDSIFDPSDTLLLLKCVSAMTSIPLLANNTEGV